MDKATMFALAREAGLKKEDYWVWHIDPLERFANLIEARLKEQGYRQCAKGQRTTQFCGMVEADRAMLRHCMKVMQEEADAYLAWHSDTNATLLAEIASLKEYLNDKG